MSRTNDDPPIGLPDAAATGTQLGQLLYQHGGGLALYASQWTADPDGCVQEALIALAKQPAMPASPVAWLYQVTKHRALNHARGEQRRRSREAESFRQRVAAMQTDTDHEQRFALAEALEQLDSRSREAIVLRLWGGLTFAEAAQTTDVSTATAQRHYQQAITELREIWSPSCPTEPKS